MPEIETPISADKIKWVFQVEQQSFIARYGVTPHFYYKQIVLQSGVLPRTYPIKLITKRVYETAQRLATIIE